MQTVPSLNIAYTEQRGYVTADVAKAENLKARATIPIMCADERI
jgi:hypothetical protein